MTVESPELTTSVTRFMEEGWGLDYAYHPQSDQEGNLAWIAKEQGKAVRFLDEPNPTFWGSRDWWTVSPAHRGTTLRQLP